MTMAAPLMKLDSSEARKSTRLLTSSGVPIRPSGVAHPIEMPNVLNVGRKVSLIEDMVKEKVVLAQE